MYPSTLILTSLLAAFTTAAPAAPKPDQCGPTNPKFLTPDNPKDTCFATPLASASPATFGVTVFKGGAVDWNICERYISTYCKDAISELYANTPYLQNDVAKLNAWKFLTWTAEGAFCQFGVYLPGDPVVAGAAPKPSEDQCRRVFGGMLDVAVKTESVVAATVNLVVDPKGQEGQVATYAVAEGTGSPVNEGFPSYMMSVGVSRY